MENLNTAQKLGFWGLVGLVVSSMAGSGIYSLPQNLSVCAGADAILAAWIITGLGIFFLAESFRILAKLKPEFSEGGLYNYANDGFGRKTGFFMVWGYWLGNIFANTGFVVIFMESLNYFFPKYFAGGNDIYSMVLGSVLIWGVYSVIAHGIKTAAAVNLIGTVIKLLPIAVFIVVCALAFNIEKFLPYMFDNFTFGTFAFEDFTAQIKGCMMVTLWAFLGIESSVILSSRAKKSKYGPRAAFAGFFFCLICYVLISLLPFGIMQKTDIAALANPSTSGVLQFAAGRWGGALMVCGLMLSVLFSLLSWVVIAVEVPFGAAQKGSFPQTFTKVNKHGTPCFSLLMTSAITQIAFLLAYFSSDAWIFMINIAGMIILPVYLISAMYLVKLSGNREDFAFGKGKKRKAFIVASLAVVYSLWLIYAADIKYLFFAVFVYAAGIPVMLKARKNQSKET